MKVLQLIDSLNPGGAERVAVNYANSLSKRIEGSYLCATREEGLLKESLSKNVRYLFLNKKSTLDLKAIRKLSRYIKINSVEIIHAHASSFFMASMIKLLNPKLILIWHDHFGNSEFLDGRSTRVLKFSSLFFNHVLCVNAKLETWTKEKLNFKNVAYLPNFAILKKEIEKTTILKGIDGKRVVCLANLRPQKDHLNLLKAFEPVLKDNSEWTLHLVGQDFNDEYFKTIKNFIQNKQLSNHVFLYGSCSDTVNILKQSTIGVLTSKSEGLPLALLEYGLAKLPVIATNVGDCQKVISNNEEGLLVEAKNYQVLAEALLTLINDIELRRIVAQNLHTKVSNDFSESRIVESLINIYKTHYK
jgi:glycosyltransferase involved in cell wall biosynthesis